MNDRTNDRTNEWMNALKHINSGFESLCSYPQYKNDRRIVSVALHINSRDLEYVSEELLDDESVVVLANGLDFQDENEAEDMSANEEDDDWRSILQWASVRVRSIKWVVMDFVGRRPLEFRYASETLCDDEEVALMAVCGNKFCFKWLSKRLRECENFMWELIYTNCDRILVMNSTARDNIDLMVLVLYRNTKLFTHASSRLQNDPKLALIVLSNQSIRYYGNIKCFDNVRASHSVRGYRTTDIMVCLRLA